MNWFRFQIVIAVFTCWLTGGLTHRLSADEVVIDNRANKKTELGGFNCSACPQHVTRAIDILAHSDSGELSAGQLWQFFHDQGVSSIDRLTLCLDVDQLDSQQVFDLKSIEFCIEDPKVAGQFLTNVNLGNNSLIVPGNTSSATKPEARLEVMLGYDFMKRFSANSREKIKLDYSSDSELSPKAKFSIEGGNAFSRMNLILLIGFAFFWLMVFYFLNRLTKPMAEANTVLSSTELRQTSHASVKSHKRVLSV